MDCLRIAAALEQCAAYNPRYFTPTREQRQQLDHLRVIAALIRHAYAQGMAAAT